MVDSSKLAPNINEADVLESSKDWSLASPINIGTDGKASMKLLWNDGKLFVQVTVKDGTSDAGDKVTIYLDKENSKSE
ncbi:MAG: CBM9 family sugar-binding protein, partial [Lachnospiraceae bacterium]|nr:CBM9 family sugar-binding protein [Lachnospiraceae bacterium]